MKLLIIGIIVCTLFLNSSLRAIITLICTIIWLIYTISFCLKLLKIKDIKISTNEMIDNLPSETSPEFIRYFISRKVDNKVFISIIFGMILKGAISLIRKGDSYYFIDNMNQEIYLTKREENVRKFLFREIGNGENVSLNAIVNASKKNGAYLYNEFQSFISTFENECASEKYFKPTKSLISGSTFYLVTSFILSLYNLLFVPNVLVFLSVFIVTAYLSIVVNNFKNIEDDRLDEYRNWIMFKNYIVNKDISDLDVELLERYSLYSYVLNCYNEFKISIDIKYYENDSCYNNSLILQLISTGIFDEIENDLNKSLNRIKLSIFKKNKGRRVKYDR